MNKQLIFGDLFTALTVLAMLGCNKECYQDPNFVRDDSGKYPINYRVVRFNTIEAYEKFIEQTDEARRERFFDSMNVNGFKNYFSNPIHLEEFATTDDGQLTDDLLMDDFLGQLLNEHGIINIGKHLYRVDMPNEKVYVLPFAKDDNYSEVAAKLTATRVEKDVMVFSTSDDVLDEIRDLDVSPEARKKRKCDGAKDVNAWSKTYAYKNSSVQFQARYLKAGIYFVARIRGKQFGVWDNVNLAFEIKPDGNNNWKAMRLRRKPCNKVHATVHHASVRYMSGSWKTYASGLREKEWVAYSGVRALNGYRFFIRGYVNGVVIPAHNDQQGWIGREVNSYF